MGLFDGIDPWFDRIKKWIPEKKVKSQNTIKNRLKKLFRSDGVKFLMHLFVVYYAYNILDTHYNFTFSFLENMVILLSIRSFFYLLYFFGMFISLWF